MYVVRTKRGLLRIFSVLAATASPAERRERGEDAGGRQNTVSTNEYRAKTHILVFALNSPFVTFNAVPWRVILPTPPPPPQILSKGSPQTAARRVPPLTRYTKLLQYHRISRNSTALARPARQAAKLSHPIFIHGAPYGRWALNRTKRCHAIQCNGIG